MEYNAQGMRWRSPASSESGWGVGVIHPGTILFATWFTFGADGNGMWLAMPDTRRTGPIACSGPVFRTRGPSFDSQPFDSTRVVPTQVGTATFTFRGPDDGTFAYNVDGVSQGKPITRYSYSAPPSTCTQTP